MASIYIFATCYQFNIKNKIMEDIENTLIVLGDMMWQKGEDGEISPSPYLFERATAAALLANAGIVQSVIFTGGKTAGVNHVSEAEAGYNIFLQTLTHQNVLTHVEPGDSMDTHENFLNVRHLVPSSSRVAVMTSIWHMIRSGNIASRIFKQPVMRLPAELILAVADETKDYKPYFFQHILHEGLKHGLRESILIPLLQIDPEGLLLKRITARRKIDKL
jgi:hypothetical protein